MKQLKLGDLIDMYNYLCKVNDKKDVLGMPVYIGDDDDLNGVHCAFYCEDIDMSISADPFVALVKESGYLVDESGCEDCRPKVILIS